MQVTHIVVQYPNTPAEMLFRASDGMCVGMAKQETVVYGDQPNKRSSHIFIDHISACRWLRERFTAEDLIAVPQEGTAVVFLEERNGEEKNLEGGGKIYMPGEMDFPGNVKEPVNMRAVGGRAR